MRLVAEEDFARLYAARAVDLGEVVARETPIRRQMGGDTVTEGMNWVEDRAERRFYDAAAERGATVLVGNSREVGGEAVSVRGRAYFVSDVDLAVGEAVRARVIFPSDLTRLEERFSLEVVFSGQDQTEYRSPSMADADYMEQMARDGVNAELALDAARRGADFFVLENEGTPSAGFVTGQVSSSGTGYRVTAIKKRA